MMPFRSAHFTSGSKVRHEPPYISLGVREPRSPEELRTAYYAGITDEEFLRLMVDNYYRSGWHGSLLEFTGMSPEEFGEWYLHGTIPPRVMRVAKRWHT